MAKQTSANMRPCRGEAAERHNRREKELDYIRKDLTHLNESKQWVTIANQLEVIKQAYQEATGQKLQSTAQPIQEIVLVIDKNTTATQVEKFCDLIKTLGMTPLSYAIHKDEGHYSAETEEWLPNYHAHIIVDTTCWDHRQVERTKKINGKNIIDPKTKKPVKIMVDGYAKTIKFSREDMSRLQDFAAEATGLERGVSSDRMHEEARRYKAREQAREIERQAKAIQEQKARIDSLEKELADKITTSEQQSETLKQQKEIIERQSKTIEEQKTIVVAQEKLMRDSVSKMQETGKEVIKNYDVHHDQLSREGTTPSKEFTQLRNWLAHTSNKDYSKASLSKIIEIIQPLSNAITLIALAAAAMATSFAHSLAESLKEKEKRLAALTRQIKEQSLWKVTKESFLSIIGRPANKQAEFLKSEFTLARAETIAAKKALEEKGQKVSNLEKTVNDLRNDNIQISARLRKYASALESKSSENDSLKKQMTEFQSQLNKYNYTIQSREKDIIKIAVDLVDHASPELIQHYELRGLHKIIGENIWKRAKETRNQRLLERQQQTYSHSRGMHR